jgi:hypothetical protein
VLSVSNQRVEPPRVTAVESIDESGRARGTARHTAAPREGAVIVADDDRGCRAGLMWSPMATHIAGGQNGGDCGEDHE